MTAAPFDFQTESERNSAAPTQPADRLGSTKTWRRLSSGTLRITSPLTEGGPTPFASGSTLPAQVVKGVAY